MRLFLLFITVLFLFIAQAQIVDDTTELVYGPKTTRFITEASILNNQEVYQNVDTSIYLFERQSFYDRSGRCFQDLGSFGTAATPVFFTPQRLIGRTSGFNAYSYYAFTPEDVKYYDTKSPFLNLLVYLGGGNRNIVDIGFSRNVNKNWNLGFDIRKITTTKQLAPEGQIDRQVVGSSFMAYTHYKHGQLPYQVLASYSTMNHKAVELGGARPTTDSLRSDYFLFDNALTRLEDAQGIVKTSNWHVYHDLQIADQFQLYHIFDYRKEINSYKDFIGNVGAGGYDLYRDFYQNFFIDPDSTNELSVFTSMINEAGLKGDLSTVFYRFYARVRTVDWSYRLYDPTAKTAEKYLGGYVRFRWKEKFAVTGSGEYLVGGDYKLKSNLSSDLIRASYTTKKYRVPFIYSDYFGNHHEWHNDFSAIFSNQLEGQLNLDFKSFEVRPKASLTAYTNFVYFDQDIQARQASEGILMSSIGGDFNLRIKNSKGESWNLENEILATNVSGGGASVVRVPDLFFNGRYFWSGKWFGDMVPVEFGLDTHGRSAYFANAYAPEIQQFYLQEDQQAFGYVAADLFVNMQVDKFLFAVKWTHINQPRNDGYFVTPYYPGQRKVIDLVVRWMFFD